MPAGCQGRQRGAEILDAHLVPCPVVKLPFGQMDSHPRRLQEPQGTVLSHLSFNRRHSAQDMAPLARLNSCSWAFATASFSAGAPRAPVRDA